MNLYWPSFRVLLVSGWTVITPWWIVGLLCRFGGFNLNGGKLAGHSEIGCGCSHGDVQAVFEVTRQKKRDTRWPLLKWPRVVFIAIVCCLIAPLNLAADAQHPFAAVEGGHMIAVECGRARYEKFPRPVCWNTDLSVFWVLGSNPSDLGLNPDSHPFSSDDSRVHNDHIEDRHSPLLKVLDTHAVNMETWFRHFHLTGHQSRLGFHPIGLLFDFSQCRQRSHNTQGPNNDKTKIQRNQCVINPIPFHRHGGEFADRYGVWIVLLFISVALGFAIAVGNALADRGLVWGGRCWIYSAGVLIFGALGCGSACIGCLPWDWWRCLGDGQRHSQRQEKKPHAKNVTQKLLHARYFLYYTNCMANVLPIDKQIAVVSALCEGNSIRAIERQTEVHRDTIMRLGVRVGQGCAALMNAKMRNLECSRLEMDEIWGYVGKKEKHVRTGDGPQVGNVWTFCAIDSDTKLVPAYHVAKERDVESATAFVTDVASRLRNRVQISTDGLQAYVAAIEQAFGEHNVDYGQIVKTYGSEESVEAQRRYSAPKITDSKKKGIFGYPDWDFISTSYVERLNATTRLHMKRLARLTHAFSKKRENFEAAVGLHFAYYNFVRRHNTLRCTPAMAAGVEQSFWSVGDLVEATA